MPYEVKGEVKRTNLALLPEPGESPRDGALAGDHAMVGHGHGDGRPGREVCSAGPRPPPPAPGRGYRPDAARFPPAPGAARRPRLCLRGRKDRIEEGGGRKARGREMPGRRRVEEIREGTELNK